MACLPAQCSKTYSQCKLARIVFTLPLFPHLGFLLIETIAVHFPIPSPPLCLSSCALSLSCRADYRAKCQSVIYGRCHETLM